jgi:integrase/recombinase XerD
MAAVSSQNFPGRARCAGAKFYARRFIDHLIETGAAIPAPPLPKKLTALDRLREEYETYLRKQRGLAESTIENCRLYMRRFLAFRFGDKLGDLNAITPNDVVAFLAELRTGSHPHRCKSVPSHLRSFFKFLFRSSKTRRDLASSLPRVAPPKDDNLPRYLKTEEIQRLIESTTLSGGLTTRCCC